jgi:hypothetical protein
MSSTSSSFVGVPGTESHLAPRREGSGWILFAGLLCVLAASLNIVSGIAAIDNANGYVNNTKFVISDLNTWGWIHLCIGVVLAAASIGVFMRRALGVWVAVAFLMVNAFTMLFFIPAAPWFAVAVFALDVLAIYGLVVYGVSDD